MAGPLARGAHWSGFELIFMVNGLAVGYFVVGLLSILCSMLLLRPAPTSA